MPAYATDGSLNISVVNGSSLVGEFAPDGSTYVVQNNGSTYTGRNHPCGGTNVVVPGSGGVMNNANGSMNISVSPYVAGTQRVTVVSGALV